jgi:ubiquinone/menaquinone biosynthesis C-methylase UbiE
MTDHEHDMWNDLNLAYEVAYQDNPYKKALVDHAIKNLKPGSRVLDIGCGTGIPVAQMLDAAGMDGTSCTKTLRWHIPSCGYGGL